jgi:predicted nucleic acid-binding protein
LLAAILASDIYRHDVDHVAVVNLALDTGLSTYDASYLYLARHLSVPLVTFDRRLQQADQGPQP